MYEAVQVVPAHEVVNLLLRYDGRAIVLEYDCCDTKRAQQELPLLIDSYKKIARE
jgi:hypothetical protein